MSVAPGQRLTLKESGTGSSLTKFDNVRVKVYNFSASPNELLELRQRITELETLETERKRTGEALRESEERYRLLLESISDSVYVLDRE